MSKLMDSQEQTRGRYDFPSGMSCGVTTVADRLREAMDDRGVDQSALARAIGVTQGSISLILVGKTRRSKYLVDIAIELGVAYDWLVSGFGDKHADSPVNFVLSNSEAEMVDALRAMPVRDSGAVRRVIESMALGRAGTVRLPSLPDLARLFESLLLALPEGGSPTENARLLATWLPIELTKYRNLSPFDETPSALTTTPSDET